MNCWNCGSDVAPDGLFCPSCEALQPPRASRDYFEILEVPRTFRLSTDVLEQSFKRLSRQLHPDRFATASARERRLSLEHATALNDAYRTLRVPVKRAEYLIGLWGRPIGEDSARSAKLPMDFLEEVMELREQLADAKLEGDREALQRGLSRVEQQWRDRYRDIEDRIVSIEAQADPAVRGKEIEALERQLHMLRYLQGMLTENGIVPAAAAPAR